MSRYLNPQGESKEAYLERNGKKLAVAPNWNSIPADKVAICLVHNGAFTAALICYYEHELEDCKKESLGRLQEWYLLNREAVA